MLSRLISSAIDIIRKQIFLQSVIKRLFPWMRSPLAMYATGLMMRYLHYQMTSVVQNNLFDKYCDISYSEYISVRTIKLCEYQFAVEKIMKWFLDIINQMLGNDEIMQGINGISTGLDELRTDINSLRADVNDLRTDMNDRFDWIHYQLNPSEILPSLLTAEDLTHEQ